MKSFKEIAKIIKKNKHKIIGGVLLIVIILAIVLGIVFTSINDFGTVLTGSIDSEKNTLIQSEDYEVCYPKNILNHSDLYVPVTSGSELGHEFSKKIRRIFNILFNCSFDSEIEGVEFSNKDQINTCLDNGENALLKIRKMRQENQVNKGNIMELIFTLKDITNDQLDRIARLLDRGGGILTVMTIKKLENSRLELSICFINSDKITKLNPSELTMSNNGTILYGGPKNIIKSMSKKCKDSTQTPIAQ